jgi:hypothetical protein
MHTRSVLIGAAAGSALMYLLDPNGGRRRRALVRDRMTGATRKTRDGLTAAARDISNRASGIAAATRGRWSDNNFSNSKLVDRVRSKLGRASSHPHAIAVEAADGVVTLRGPVLASEVQRVLATVAAVRGVVGVRNDLEPHASAAGVPSLQGEGKVSNPLRTTRSLVGIGMIATGAVMAFKRRRSQEWEHQYAGGWATTASNLR